MRNLDKFKGCLIGGAVGDALGYAVEFLQEDQIFKLYGENGITEYALRNGKAEISDDTQMTLFTANGLLVGTTREMTKGMMGSYQSYIQIMYKCWYRTQTENFPIKDKYKYSWLLDVPELFSRRAPGMTCMSAIKHGADGSVTDHINDSKGCGGVMRVAPVGLYFADKNISYDETDMIGAEAAALTHGHSLGYIPAAALVHIIRAVCEREITLKSAVNEAIIKMQELFDKDEHISEFSSIMNKAVKLSEQDINDLDAIHQLGEGWVAEETLAIAVYCALKHIDSFDKAIRASVNHNGDSDSTGSVTGNILGAYLGYNAIPEKYISDLELHDIISEIAEDLYEDCQIAEYKSSGNADNDRKWKMKYIYNV